MNGTKLALIGVVVGFMVLVGVLMGKWANSYAAEADAHNQSVMSILEK